MMIRIEPQKIAGFRVPEKQGIGDGARIETGANQILLLLFESFGGLQRRAQADKDRAGVSWQPSRQVIAEHCEIEVRIGDIAAMPARPSAPGTATP